MHAFSSGHRQRLLLQATPAECYDAVACHVEALAELSQGGHLHPGPEEEEQQEQEQEEEEEEEEEEKEEKEEEKEEEEKEEEE